MRVGFCQPDDASLANDRVERKEVGPDPRLLPQRAPSGFPQTHGSGPTPSTLIPQARTAETKNQAGIAATTAGSPCAGGGRSSDGYSCDARPGVDLPLCTVDVAEVPRCARLGVGVIGDRLKRTGLHASRCTLAGSRLTPHESGKSLLIAFRSIPARPIRTSLGAAHPGCGLASGLGGPLGVRACEVQREGEQ